MSWEERSCKLPCRCPDKCSMETCAVDCPCYIWDGKTVPDSGPRQVKWEPTVYVVAPSSLEAIEKIIEE